MTRATQRLTGRGWAVVATAVVSLVAGHLLGLADLFIVGAGLAGVLITCAVYVRVARPELTATRRVLPPRVHAGASSRVELTLVNRTRRRSPVLSVRDPFDGGARWARFLVASLAPAEEARAAYRLPTEHRGVFDLGPLEIELTDPFGLIGTIAQGAPTTRLTVFPRIDRVAPSPRSHGDDPLAGADHPRGFTGGGEDFYGLRPYVRGDDLRKVHWPSTARADDLMLRQDEMAWQARCTVVVDNRATICPLPALEILVSAAASIVVAAARHDGLQRLLTSEGYDSRSIAGTGHVDAILEHLAGLGTGDGQFLELLGAIRRSHTRGSVVLLTTALMPAADFQAIAVLGARYANVTLVVVEPSAWGDPFPCPTIATSAKAIRVGEAGFAAAWTAAIGRTGPRVGSLAGGRGPPGPAPW